MYDRPSNRVAHDALWALIRDGLRARDIAAPDMLNRTIAYDAGWAAPDLVLSQICNLPYRAQFKNRVTLIGASDYGLPDCPPGHYRGLFVVHNDAKHDTPRDYAQSRFVCNDLLSQSGYGAAQLWAQQRGFQFSAPTITGAHDHSLAAVARGQADIACIDAQTFWMQQQDDPLSQDVRVIGTTDTSPGQSFVTGPNTDPAPFFDAISHAIAALPATHRNRLGLRQIVRLSPTAYELPLPAPLRAPPT